MAAPGGFDSGPRDQQIYSVEVPILSIVVPL